MNGASHSLCYVKARPESRKPRNGFHRRGSDYPHIEAVTSLHQKHSVMFRRRTLRRSILSCPDLSGGHLNIRRVDRACCFTANLHTHRSAQIEQPRHRTRYSLVLPYS